MLFYITIAFTLMHIVSCTITGKRAERIKATYNLSDADVECMRQHHEKCVMLGVIALAIIGR